MENKPIKTVKSESEIRRFFNTKIVNSEKVVIGGKTMYMTVNKLDDLGKEVKHKVKNLKSNGLLNRNGFGKTFQKQITLNIQPAVLPQKFQ